MRKCPPTKRQEARDRIRRSARRQVRSEIVQLRDTTRTVRRASHSWRTEGTVVDYARVDAGGCTVEVVRAKRTPRAHVELASAWSGNSTPSGFAPAEVRPRHRHGDVQTDEVRDSRVTRVPAVSLARVAPSRARGASPPRPTHETTLRARSARPACGPNLENSPSPSPLILARPSNATADLPLPVFSNPGTPWQPSRWTSAAACSSASRSR